LGSWFSFISNPFEAWLGALALFVGGAGIAIILFTIIIRLILAPLQIVQLRSARAMQKLQPHIAELRKKHGKDRQKLTEETMKLYKEHRVNPAMGCLPMLLQFPVLIGLFWALRALGDTPTGPPVALAAKNVGRYLATHPCLKAAIHGKAALHAVAAKSVFVTLTCWNKLNPTYPKGYWLSHVYHASIFSSASSVSKIYVLFHAHFLWLSNGLGQHDPLFILPALAGITQWIQSRMMMQKSSDPQQQSMNMLMNFTPLIIVFFAAQYPSGLSLYWVTSTIIGILVSVRITGWGTLPRLDRMLLGTAAPASGVVSTKQKTVKRSSTKPSANGNPTDADIVLSDGDVDSEVGNDGGVYARSQTGGSRARQGRRRSTRRGGRRG